MTKLSAYFAALGTTPPTVTVTGKNFLPSATVKFGTTAVPTTYVSSTSLTATPPVSTTAGSVDVAVTTPGGTSADATADLFAYGPPTITGFTPTSGITGSTVTVNGSGFATGVTISFGSMSAKVTLVATSTKVAPGTQAKVVVPNGDGVPTALTVTDPLGSQTSAGQFTPTMAITSFTPTSGSKSGSTLITVNGVGFSPDSTVAVNGVTVTANYVSSTQMTFTVPTTVSSGYIRVTSPTTDIPSGKVTSATKLTITS